jgi:hypothetical protein
LVARRADVRAGNKFAVRTANRRAVDRTEVDVAVVAAEERDAQKLRKFDKVFNWIAGIVFGAAALILVWRILDAYLL